MSGCYPGDIDDVEELDTVSTFFAQNSDFASVHTFALIDSVVPIPEDETIPVSLSAAVLNTTRENLTALGWTELTGAASRNADVVVATAVSSITYVYQDWYAYWGWWPYWDASWAGWGWYWPYPVTYVYDIGTVSVTMVEQRAARADEQLIPVIWQAFVRGVAQTTGDNAARAAGGIDQAFAQSDYLAGPAASRRRSR
jgi:hypothetical protein